MLGSGAGWEGDQGGKGFLLTLWEVLARAVGQIALDPKKCNQISLLVGFFFIKNKPPIVAHKY